MSIKRILIVLGIIFGIGLLGFVSYGALYSDDITEKKVSNFLTEDAIRQIMVNTMVYYDENGTVPQKLTDLYSFSSSLSQDTPGISSVEYRYIDPKNAEVCPASDRNKCKRFTGK